MPSAAISIASGTERGARALKERFVGFSNGKYYGVNLTAVA